MEGPRTRQQLAEEGMQQVQQLMRTCQSMVEGYGAAARAVESAAAQPASTAGGADAKPEQPGALQPAELVPERLTQQLKGLQQQYADAAAAARRTLQQCRDFEQQEARAAASQPAPTAQEEQAGRARCDGLRRRLEERNQLVKMLIDRLRLLLDALTMWEAHAAQLAAAS